MNWFKRKPPTPPPQVRIVERDVFRCTLAEWRVTPDLVKVAAEVLRDSRVRRMLDVLMVSNLTNYECHGTTKQAARHLARCEGYLACLRDFESLGIAHKPEQEIEHDYPKPDDEV